ncbi:MAG TPA: SCO family protein [Candidatus Angelobacter sp.]|nr:SCO family protein [Candidatus Angelobacter sp.]
MAAAALLACAGTTAWSQAAPKLMPGDNIPNVRPAILKNVGIDQHLGRQIPLDLTFKDEKGQPVQLRQYFASKPVILELVYFKCPMLCSEVQAGLTGALNGIVRFNVGRDFDVLTVSFDPRDTPQDAARDKKVYLSRYRRAGSEQGWHYLTGGQEQIAALADAVGFHYTWDAKAQQFAHASGIMLLTPDGHISQYYYGIEYMPRDLQLGLIESSKGKIGNLADQVLLFCFHYDPTEGRYGAAIFNILRATAALTVLLLGGFIFIMFRRDIRAAKKNQLRGLNQDTRINA